MNKSFNFAQNVRQYNRVLDADGKMFVRAVCVWFMKILRRLDGERQTVVKNKEKSSVKRVRRYNSWLF